VRTTLVVPTYQRREAVLRLLRGLSSQASPELDVLVVVDGSTDGTADAVESLARGYPVPLRALVQDNRGLSGARNAGLRAVDHDGVVWFLDDDMVPADGLVERHARAHDVHASDAFVLMGACRIPPHQRVPGANRAWYDQVHDELVAAGAVTDPSLFSAANTSARRAVWERVGAFHEGFVGWGGEDYEIAVRLLRDRVSIAYDGDAVALHLQERGIVAFCRTKEGEGANAARIAALHPDQTDLLFPPTAGAAATLRRLRRRPALLRGAARAAAVVAAGEVALSRGRRHRALDFAVSASRAAGVASVDGDGELLSRLLDDRAGRLATR